MKKLLMLYTKVLMKTKLNNSFHKERIFFNFKGINYFLNIFNKKF